MSSASWNTSFGDVVFPCVAAARAQNENTYPCDVSGGRNGLSDTCACQSWSNAFSTLMKRPYRPLRAAEVDWTTTVISPSGHACELIDPVSYDSRLSWSSTFGGGDGGGDGGLGGGETNALFTTCQR